MPAILLIAGVAVTFGLTGCQDAARRPITARPLQNPTPALVAARAAAVPPVLLEVLPLDPRRGPKPILGIRVPHDDVAAPPPVAVAAVPQIANPDAEVEEERSEPAPIDEIAAHEPAEGVEGESAPPIDPILRTRAEGELGEVSHDLPLTVNNTVLSFVNYFQTTRGRAIVETGLRRAGRFRQMIERVLREEGMPLDLIYLAQAESAFQPQALSRAGARGLWQFMSFRGQEYGLQHDRWVDDRQDPEKATRAAAAHLRDLYQEFGDWYLAMAAYNSGPGAVARAVERTGYADFWELYKRNVLPKETRNYVPIILALTLIAKDPARYGVAVVPDEPLRYDTVQLGHVIDLRLVADTLDVDLETLRSLNPQLLRVATPADPAFALRIPEGSAEHFLAEMASIPPENWTTWRRHRVAEGDTLSGIAKKFKVATTAIASANNLEADAPLETGGKLIIPISAATQPPLGKLVRYQVRTGDTLASIADDFGVTLAEIRKWNGLRSTTTRVARGVRLKIYNGGLPPVPVRKPPTSPTTAKGKPITPEVTVSAGKSVSYHVRQGETLWAIARAFETTVETLRSANQYLFSRPLQAGDTLIILPAR